jgi:NAD(P)H-dependent FMN reductase
MAASVLALSGSLRRSSSNTTLLRAAARLAPAGVTITLFDGLGDLPLFNPDLEDAEIATVAAFRARLRAADGVLICSPEYAHGVSGVMKNALDWVVGSGELSGKPVALLSAAPWATHANAHLTETLKTMDAAFVEEASIAVRILPKTLDEDGIAAHPEIAPVLRAALIAFARALA